MMKIVNKTDKNYYSSIISDAEKEYGISVRDDIIDFIKLNGGGFPVKDLVVFDGEEYEVRVFLSADKEDRNYCIERALNFFLKNTNGKIIPIGIDSGDNYYCVDNTTGKVYYWRAGENQYYYLAECLEMYAKAFK